MICEALWHPRLSIQTRNIARASVLLGNYVVTTNYWNAGQFIR